MTPTMNGGYEDQPEDQQEMLAQWDRPCGKRLLESWARIASGRRHLADSQARLR